MYKSKPFPPTGLIILDGFGYHPQNKGNAIAQSHMPHWKEWMNQYPHTLLSAAQEAVGLPAQCIGNSEVGHLTIGTGRTIPSTITLFNESIKDRSIYTHPVLKSQFPLLKQQSDRLHILGLLSDAGVHSHINHIIALLDIAKHYNITTVLLHLFLDGRDCPPKTAGYYLDTIETAIQKIGLGTIASLHGRYYAMDRDNNWDRTQISYETLTQKIATATSWQKALNISYQKKENDQFFKPIQLELPNQIKSYIQKNDGVLCANFRADRASQLIEALIAPKFKQFNRHVDVSSQISFCITTTRYKKEFKSYNNQILFSHSKPKNTLFDVLSSNKKKVFFIAETEKKAHVTYFLHGEQNIVLPNETIKLVPSLKLKNYNHHPEMSAPLITQSVLENLHSSPHDLYVVNYANADMVAHSADFSATMQACSHLDKELKILFDWFVIKHKGVLFITADHGNAEQLLDPTTEKPTSSHSINPVPFLALGKMFKNKQLAPVRFDSPIYSLANIAPTVLTHFGLEVPREMRQESILEF